MFQIIGYILYTVVFQFLLFLKLVVHYYQLISFKIKNIVSQLFMFLYIKSPNDYIDYINTVTVQQQQQQQPKHTSSTPRHLALILNHKDQIKSIQNNTETINFYNKVSDILIWSVIVGIKRITVFDNHGSLKKNISTFQNLLENKIKPFNCTSEDSNKNKNNNTTYSFKWLNNLKTTNENNNNNNKNTNLRILTISIVTVEDGKQELVNITKKYIEDSKLDSTIVLNEQYVNSNLPNYIGGVDFEPEVALDFSDKHLFSGFLPWHIKLTEFIKMEHFSQFYLERFHQFLKIYGNIQKRCGK